MLILCFAVLWCSKISANGVNKELAIIPKPVSIVQGTGSFVFSGNTRIYIAKYPNDSIKNIAKDFIQIMHKATGLKFSSTRKAYNAQIQMQINTSLPGEAYKLNITTQNITIEAAQPAGFYYALQTLKQLMPRNVMAGVPDVSVSRWQLPVVTVQDQPRFEWRGFMLDEGRHFFGKEQIKRVIDMMAVYKMNRFHWHLTEDQGWRIEIKKYPKLTEVGAWRNSKTLAWGEHKPDNERYGGYYTQKDIREIVAYARKNFIEIIPEVDIPGHSQAAVAAYPEQLACDPENQHSVWLWQGVSTDVINVANPWAVQFAKDVIDELTELFPFEYIHLGGDECPTGKWEKNEACKTLLTQLGSTRFRDLQTHFYTQLQEHMQGKPIQKQRKLVFWNEVLHGNTDALKNITIMAWIGADKAAQEAEKKGFDNILTPQIPYYINRKQASGKEEPMSQGNGSETVEAVYNYVPAKGVPSDKLKYYKGVQANFWTEWVVEPQVLEYLILPRLAAVAEAGWSAQDIRNYADFKQRIKVDAQLYDLKGWNYGKHIMK